MKFDQIKELKDEKFSRLTGVRKGTFSKMVDILRKVDGLKKSKSGRKNKLNLWEQLMKGDMNYEVVFIDATDSPIERPKKKQKFY
ncbi:DDE superendonuclease family protein [Orientia tsutsugamushi str. Kato PP]|uniref:IS5 family transposase ISOt6 n=1 Tax=Orientia tsutsugamushi TaxID=784 RepID=A0A2U3QTS2_ORITS|nr:DDE superendonuclease family protein [Orientia tsutsugamushi str. Kato PP]SPR04371.1 IS5 family transposase ISOt6 [Orientia tsutsugamushi]